jgi:hypothetical protein
MRSFAGRWKELASGTAAAVRRFPLPLAAGLVGAIAGVAHMSPWRSFAPETMPLRVLLTCWVGLPLLLTAALAGGRGTIGRLPLSIGSLATVAACFAGLGGRSDWTFIRFALFLIAAHGLLALAPLARPAPRGDFRPFNLMLFARTALALLLTHVLWAGLCFALAAIEHLFDVHVANELYPDLWFVLLGVFNTAYVLAGIPPDWDRLEGRFPTPKPLDVLARHVLLPLSLLYLGILYVYSVKIIVVHQWPRGWVSAPIIVFAAIGLLTVLLLEPGRLTGSRLVRAYCRGFFVALLPLVVLLFLAISRRAFEYGLTEERCLVYAIAVFLALIAPYFVLSRARNLAAIPLLLAAIAVVTAVGPLSARSLSVRSQTARLRTLLEQNHRLENGVLVHGAQQVSAHDEHEISAALLYLDGRQALAPVLAWRPTRVPCSGCEALVTAATPRMITSALGLSYRPWREYDEGETSTRISTTAPVAVETTGFDVVFPQISCAAHDSTCRGPEGKGLVSWSAQTQGTDLILARDGREVTRIRLGELERQAATPGSENDKSPRDPIVLEGRWSTGHYRLYISYIVFDRQDDGSTKVMVLTGVLLLGLQTPQ